MIIKIIFFTLFCSKFAYSESISMSLHHKNRPSIQYIPLGLSIKSPSYVYRPPLLLDKNTIDFYKKERREKAAFRACKGDNDLIKALTREEKDIFALYKNPKRPNSQKTEVYGQPTPLEIFCHYFFS